MAYFRFSLVKLGFHIVVRCLRLLSSICHLPCYRHRSFWPYHKKAFPLKLNCLRCREDGRCQMSDARWHSAIIDTLWEPGLRCSWCWNFLSHWQSCRRQCQSSLSTKMCISHFSVSGVKQYFSILIPFVMNQDGAECFSFLPLAFSEENVDVEVHCSVLFLFISFQITRTFFFVHTQSGYLLQERKL